MNPESYCIGDTCPFSDAACRSRTSHQVTSCVTSLRPENGGGVCATYRFEGGATRLRVRARTTEGDYGDVRLTVVAEIPHKKSAQVRSLLHTLGGSVVASRAPF